MSKELSELLGDTGFVEADIPGLRRVVAADTDAELVERLKTLRTLSFTEYLQWAAARRRFGSVSELDTARVLSLFVSVRHSPVSVEALVEDLGIPQARATSMIGRMKYAEGRALVALSFAAAAADVESRLADAAEQDNRKSITTSREIVDRISEVAFAIISSPARDLGKDGKYESSEAPTIISGGRYGATVSTSTKTWGYILAELKARGGA